MKFGSLRITTTDGRTREYPIDLPALVVGRADGNNIVIDDLSVARRHARLAIDSGRLMVEDLGSANGTFIDGERLTPNTPGLAEANAEIRFGDAVASFIPAVTEPEPGGAAGGTAVGDSAPAEALELPAAIHAVLDVPPEPIDPGGAGLSAILTVQNRGRVVDELQITVENLPPEWLAVSTNKVVLLPGATASVTILVQPPRHTDALAGVYDFSVVVTSVETGREVLVGGQVAVRQFNGLGLSLDPVRGRKDFQLRVENQANALMTYALAGTDDEEAFQFHFEQPTIELPPGKAAELKVRVAPKKRKLFGAEKAVPFTVAAESTTFMGGKTETGGELIVHPPLEPLKRPAMFSVFLVLVAAAAFAFFFLAGDQATKAVSPEAAYAGVHMCEKGGRGTNPVPTPADAPISVSDVPGQGSGGLQGLGDPDAGAPYFMQNDPRWGTVEYAKAADPDFGPDWCGTTIAQCGCAMTSVTNVMAIFQLLTMPDGQPLTPQSVNAWFNLNARKTARGWVSQGYIYGDVIWTAVNQLSGEIAAKQPGSRTLRFAGTGTGSDAEVKEQLQQQRPVVLEVPGHWIIAYGLDGDKIKIHDPYYADRQVLQDAYAGKVKSSVLFEPSEDLSAVVITVPADTRIRVTDKQGRVVGTLDTGSAAEAAEQAKRQIPGASYTTHQAWRDPTCVESAPPQDAGTNQIVLPGRREDYKIEVLETSGGPTSVSIHTYDRNGQPAIQTLDNNTGGLTADVAFDPSKAGAEVDVVHKRPIEQESSAKTAGAGTAQATAPIASPTTQQAPASPTAEPTPDTSLQTTLSVSAPAGATTIPVASNQGFGIGDIIRISPGNANEEDNRIVGFGSFVLATPLKFAHSAGETIVRISAGTGGQPAPPVDTGGGGLEPKPPESVALNCSAIYSVSPKNATLICSTTISGTFTTTRWTVDGRVQPQLNGKTVMLTVYTVDALTSVSVTACNLTLCTSDQATQTIRFPSTGEPLTPATPAGQPTAPPPTVTPPPSGGGINIDCNMSFDTTPQAVVQCASASLLKHTSIAWTAPGLTPPGVTGQSTGFKATAGPGDLRPGLDGNATVEVTSTWCNLNDCTKSAPFAVKVPYATTSLSLLPSTVVQGNSVTFFSVITGPVVPSGGRVTFMAAKKGTSDFEPLGLDVKVNQLAASGFASMTVQTREGFLGEGDYDVIAVYSGGTNIFGGQSAKVALRVTPPIVDICNSVDDNGNGFIDENCNVTDSGGSGQKAIGSGVILSNTDINGGGDGAGTTGVVVAPEQELTVTVGVAREAEDPCPDCMRQVYLGIGENTGAFPRVPQVGPYCILSDSLPDPTTTVPKSVSQKITAPKTPGIYYIRATASLQASCGKPEVGAPDASVARFVVQADTKTTQAVPSITTLGNTIHLEAEVESPASGTAWPGTIPGVVQFCDWWGVDPVPENPANCDAGHVLATAPVQRFGSGSTVTFRAETNFDTHGLYATFGTPVGEHHITAIYLPWPGESGFDGPPVYLGSHSDLAVLDVRPAPSQVGVSLGQQSVALGSAVAMVAGLSTPPEFGDICGTIDFLDDVRVLAHPDVAQSGLQLARIEYDTTDMYSNSDPDSVPPIGSHPISVRYQPAPCEPETESNYASSASTSAMLTITPAPATVAVSFTPSNSGQLAATGVSVTATLSAGAFGPFAGEVQFACDGTAVGNPVDSAAGTASLSLDSQWVSVAQGCNPPYAGKHAWTAMYTPNGSNYAGAVSAEASYTFTAATTTMTVEIPASKKTVQLGAATTLTAEVEPPPGIGSQPFGSLDGTIEFRSPRDGTILCTSPTSFDAGGDKTVASCSANSSLLYSAALPNPVGGRTVAGTFIPIAGSSYLGAASSNEDTLTVDPATTTMELVVSPATVVLGGSATLTATVHGGPFGDFTGTVTFTDASGAPIGEVGIGTNGVATLEVDSTTLTNAVGTHQFGASYAGGANSNYADASVPDGSEPTLTVTAAPTTLTLTADPLAVPVGGSVTLSAQLSGPSFGAFTGSVDFYEDDTKLTTNPIDVTPDGKASWTVTNLGAGKHTYTARYSGGGNYAASTSNQAQALGQRPTVITLVVSPNPVVTPDDVTFTATVSCPSCGSSQPALGGSIDFFDGIDVLNPGPKPLENGNKVTLTLPSGQGYLTVGPGHIISARYYGSGEYSGSDSTLVQLAIKANTITTLEPEAANVLSDGTTSITATIDYPYTTGENAMTGQVEFYKDGTLYKTVAVAEESPGKGKAILVFEGSDAAMGPHTVTAKYLGDGIFAASESGNSATVTVQHATSTSNPTTTPDSSNNPIPSADADNVKFSTIVQDSILDTPVSGGQVEFYIDDSLTPVITTVGIDGVATTPAQSLTPGQTHKVKAVYLGSGNYAGSESGETTFKVLAATEVKNASANPNPVERNTSFQLSADVFVAGTSTRVTGGTLKFREGATVLCTVLDLSSPATPACTVDDGLASVGNHSITAEYTAPSDSYYEDSVSETFTLAVAPTPTMTTVTNATPNPVEQGKALILTAAVTANEAGANVSVNGGKLTFYDDGIGLPTCTDITVSNLAPTTCSLAAGLAMAGLHKITAKYTGTTGGSYGNSQSEQPLEVVVRATTTITLSSTIDNDTRTVTIDVVITPTDNGTYSGTVTLSAGGTDLGSKDIGETGLAQFTLTAVADGSYTYEVVFSGGGGYAASSETIEVTVPTDP